MVDRATTHRRPVDLDERFGQFTDPWSPHLVARLNDYDIKLVRLAGEFVWHTHEETDELFLVLHGTLIIQLRDGDVTLTAGQLFVVPRGVEHCPKTTNGEVRASSSNRPARSTPEISRPTNAPPGSTPPS